MLSSLVGNNVLAIQDLEKQDIVFVLEQAARLEDGIAAGGGQLLSGRVLAPLFCGPDMWVRSSFESAMRRLGGQVLGVPPLSDDLLSAEGGDLARRARIASGFADIIAHRHPEVYSAHEAAKGGRVPLINAGDGTYEHPTQALVDLYTMRKERGAIDGLSIAIVGDLRHSAAAHSLARALVHWEVELRLISPASLEMATVLTVPLKRALPVVETEDLASGLAGCDVVYVTPIQEKHFRQASDARRARQRYCVDRPLLESAKDDSTLMHPLPLGDEIAAEVDALPGAAYFRQAKNGVWPRAALLALLLDAL